jgi:hypothetical protein
LPVSVHVALNPQPIVFDYCSQPPETPVNTPDTPTKTDTSSNKRDADAAATSTSSASTSDTSLSLRTLPAIRSPHQPDEIAARLAKLSQRGRIPGFERPNDGLLFTATAFGQPFDRTLEAHAEPDGDNGTTLRFSTKLKRALPWTFGLITAFTVWPGVWLTDELCRTYFTWYDYATWMWYLPITVVPLPWMVRSIMRKSQAAAAESSHDLIERIREAVDGVQVDDTETV